MSKKILIDDLPEFALAEQLTSEEGNAACLTMVIADGDAAERAHAVGLAARARGMSELSVNMGFGCFTGQAAP